jgi:hypothetical protein
LAVKVIPGGRAPDSLRVACGQPLVVTVNVPAWPGWNTVEGLDVMASGATSTVKLVDALPPWYVTVAVIVAIPLRTVRSLPLRVTRTTLGRFEVYSTVSPVGSGPTGVLLQASLELAGRRVPQPYGVGVLAAGGGE